MTRLAPIIATAVLVTGCAPNASGAPSPMVGGGASESAAEPVATSTPVPLTLRSPDTIAVGPDGDIYIADCLSYRVMTLDREGALSPVAGSGAPRHAGDGGPALEAAMECPSGVAVDSARNVYIVEHISNRVRRVDADGVITTVVGAGPIGWHADETTGEEFFGDGGPAVEAAINEPGSLAVAEDGSLYIGDRDNRRIRRVDPNGIITTVAGTGEIGSGGDGGPAVEAQLTAPTVPALGPDRALYILDVEVHRIRVVGADGVIRTVAGTGEPGFSGDGGPAVAAQLFQPRGIAVDAAGNLYISDAGNNRIRRVDADGTMTTIAGTGERETSGDGGPAIEASVSQPHSIAVDVEGKLYFVDWGSLTIRVIDAQGIIRTVGPTGP